MLLDTDVLSELVRPKPDPRVQAFVRVQTDPLISALTIHEIVFGAERVSDPARQANLIGWSRPFKVSSPGVSSTSIKVSPNTLEGSAPMPRRKAPTPIRSMRSLRPARSREARRSPRATFATFRLSA
jgi:hypothetical protein